MRKRRILIVEDERVTAKFLELDLKAMGYDIAAVVSSGEEAILKAQQTNPDLALMDILLDGEMDGIEAARIIKSFLDIPFIYLTAHADRETRDRAAETEPIGYLVKPIRQSDLHAAIGRAFTGCSDETI